MTRNTAVKWLKAITYIGIYGGLLLPLVFVPVVIFPFVFSKHICFQVLIGLTFPAYIALAWAEPKYRPRWKAPLFIAIGFYFIALALSVVFAADPLRAWWGNQERMNGLFQVLHFFIWMVMTSSMLHTWKQWKNILMYEVALGVFMGCVSLLQLPFPRLLMFQAGPRVGGLLDNPIYMAAYQMFNLFFILMLWLKGAKSGTKIFLGIAAVVDIAAFLATQSRGGLVGLFIGLLAFGFFYSLMSTSKKAKIAIVSVIAFIFVFYGVVYFNRTSKIVQDTGLARLVDLNATIDTRLIAWHIAWNGFIERPLTGWGLDNYHILFNKKYNPQSLEHGYYETWFDRSHNTLFDVLSMTGLFGMLAYIGVWWALFYSIFRAYRKKWIDPAIASIILSLPIGYFVQNLFVFDQPAGFTMSYLLYGLVIAATSAEFDGLAKHEDAVDKKIDAIHTDIPVVTLVLVYMFSLFIIWHGSILPWKASYYSIASNNNFSAGTMEESFRLAKIAAATPTPYLDEQIFLETQNLMKLVDNNSLSKVPFWKEWHDLVVSIAERHLAQHGMNTHPLFVYATFLQSFASSVPEDGPKAEIYYQRALETSPTRQQLLFTIARWKVIQGKKQEGYEYFKRALDEDGHVGESHWYVGLSLSYDLNKKDEGSKELIASQNVSSPYSIKNARELAALSDAYANSADIEGWKKNIFEQIRNFTNGDVSTYVQIARGAEKLHLLDQRNLLLKAIQKLDPETEIHFGPVLSGMVKTIDESLNMTSNTQSIAQPAAAVPGVTITPDTPGIQIVK